MRKTSTLVLVLGLGWSGLQAATPCVQATAPESKQTGSIGESAEQNQNLPRKTEFVPTMMGKALDEDGVHLGFTNYKGI
jgi:hypothetical protein